MPPRYKEQADQVEVRQLACSLGFHAITLERSTSNENPYFKTQASVEINLLVSLFCCLVARGGDGRTE